KHLTESFAGYGVYVTMDLYSGYDQHMLHIDSCCESKCGKAPHWLTTLPQGHVNAVHIYQGDTTFVLQDEIPHHSLPFINDILVKSETTCYQCADGSYETIPENHGVCRFIWNHCIVINCILQHLLNIKATISAKKFILAAPSAVIISHKCTFEGCVPEESKVQKICNWPKCHNLTQVYGFPGICSVLCIFIKDFTKIMQLPVALMQKDMPFTWDEPQCAAMQ
ncbi:hypothetical protein BKA82DRAFT_159863, partial [Pisolithus tinctorius]